MMQPFFIYSTAEPFNVEALSKDLLQLPFTVRDPRSKDGKSIFLICHSQTHLDGYLWRRERSGDRIPIGAIVIILHDERIDVDLQGCHEKYHSAQQFLECVKQQYSTIIRTEYGEELTDLNEYPPLQTDTL